MSSPEYLEEVSMHQNEEVWRDVLGGIVIRAKLGEPLSRKGYEREFFRGVEVGLPGWERAHSQGPITGYESAYGIRYAPEEVNQEYQRLGIEKFIRRLRENAQPDVDFFLTTVTYTHKDSLRLKEIIYRLEVMRGLDRAALFEASIEIEDRRTNPRVWVSTPEVRMLPMWAI